MIAFGGAKLTAADTRDDARARSIARRSFGIVEALVARDAKKVLACVEELDERAPDYREVLADLAALLQKLALLQAVPDLQLDEAEDIETYQRLAGAFHSGRRAAVLPDRDRRPARPRARARRARRIRDDAAAHAGVSAWPRARRFRLRLQRAAGERLQPPRAPQTLRRAREATPRRRPRPHTIGRRWSRR